MQPCVEREQSRSDIRRMRGRAVVVREDRMLAVLASPRVAAIAAVQAAGIFQPPVPAARRLEQVAADRAHVAELRGRRKPARLAQRFGDLGARLELGERRSRADPTALHAARNVPADVDEHVGLEDPVAKQRNNFGAAGK